MSRRTVRLHHPKTGGRYDAPASAVPALRMSGWVPVDQVPDQSSPTATPTGTGAGAVAGDGGGDLDRGGTLAPGQTEARTGRAEPVTHEPKPRRGRRTTTQED